MEGKWVKGKNPQPRRNKKHEDKEGASQHVQRNYLMRQKQGNARWKMTKKGAEAAKQ